MKGNYKIMAKVIEAVYENGVFRLLEKINLKEGEVVKVEIKEKKISEKFIKF